MNHTNYEIYQKNNNENYIMEKQNIEKETYSQKRFLGEGAFGKVYLIQSNKTNLEYVCKNIDLSSSSEEKQKSALSEVSVLKKCKHPNIILFKEAFITRKPKRVLHLITEYAENGDLEHIKKNHKQKNEYFEEKIIINWLIQICLALKYIHELHVIHRDIKPSNIFLTKKGIIKIGDFGISKILAKDYKNTKTHIGTAIYMAPEVIESEKYDYKADIWSLGITFFELTTFNFPFKGNNEFALLMNIINGKKYNSINNINGNYYSDELIYIINRMIQKNPKDRPTIGEILDVPIIKKNLEEFLAKNKDLYDGLNLSVNDKIDNNREFKNKSANELMLTIINEENEDREYSKFPSTKLLKQNSKDFIQMTESNNSNLTGLNGSFKENITKKNSMPLKIMSKTNSFQ